MIKMVADKEQTIVIKTKGDWTANELEKFVWSVRMIYDAYLILKMARNHLLHKVTFDTVLEQLSKLEDVSHLQSWKALHNMWPTLDGANKMEGVESINRLFVSRLFNMLSEFIDDYEKLSIAWVRMGSDGGIGFKMRVKRFRDEDKDQDPKSPLLETENYIATLAKGEIDVWRKVIQENRTVDPRLLELTSRVVIDGPTEVITELAKSGKIGSDSTKNDRYEKKIN
jgi:hypothetical protein